MQTFKVMTSALFVLLSIASYAQDGQIDLELEKFGAAIDAQILEADKKAAEAQARIESRNDARNIVAVIGASFGYVNSTLDKNASSPESCSTAIGKKIGYTARAKKLREIRAEIKALQNKSNSGPYYIYEYREEVNKILKKSEDLKVSVEGLKYDDDTGFIDGYRDGWP